MSKALRPRKQPSQGRSKATVTAILEAAAHIFEEQGYGKMTTNAVAELAGVSIGSLYQYFPNKEALICAVYECHHARMRESIAREMNKPLDVANFEALRHLVEAIARAHLVEPELHAKFESLRFEEPFAEILREKDLGDIQRRLELLLRENKKAYAIEDEVFSAEILVSAVHSLVHVFTGHTANYRKAASEIARMLFGYISAYKSM